MYYSADDNVATLGHIVSSGAASVAAGSSSVTLVGLQPSSRYYVNVLVQDERGNQAAYGGVDVTTTVPGPTCTDAGVGATAVDENHLYIGGSFTRAGPCLTRGAVLSKASAQLSIPFAGYAAANGAVEPRLPTVLAGGTSAAISPKWARSPATASPTVSGSTVYLGGIFDTVGGQARAYIAAVGGDGTLSA